MKKSIHKERKAGEPMADAMREKFAQQLAAGMSQAAALRIANPKAKSWNDNSAKVKASRLASEPEIEKRKQEILEDTIPSTVLKRNEMLVLISDELRDAAKEPGMLAAASALVDKFSKLMDWYPHPELTLKNGGVSDDYKAPPGIAGLSDEQIRQLLGR